jgi:hypothetical protein
MIAKRVCVTVSLPNALLFDALSGHKSYERDQSVVSLMVLTVGMEVADW